MSPRAMFSNAEREQAAEICDLLASFNGAPDDVETMTEAAAALGLDLQDRQVVLALSASVTISILENASPGFFYENDNEQWAEVAALLRTDGWLPGDRIEVLPRFDDGAAEVHAAPVIEDPLGRTIREGHALCILPMPDVQVAVGPEVITEIAAPDEVTEAIASDAPVAAAEDTKPDTEREITAAPRGFDDTEEPSTEDEEQTDEVGSLFDDPSALDAEEDEDE